LPGMLLAALGGERPAGVMIARGDLAVECGYERLAEVQEEILWLCQATHMPVIWATQVLDRLAMTGRPSRAEITDAAMGVQAECVMLNKGPRILEAISVLDDILRRMERHRCCTTRSKTVAVGRCSSGSPAASARGSQGSSRGALTRSTSTRRRAGSSASDGTSRTYPR
jgi:pyruvate kinase